MQVHTNTKSAPVAPKSVFGQFVLSDVKKGEAAHAFRLSMLAAAVHEGYKGNPNGLTEAKTACDGRSVVARAYQAGLAALPVVSKLAFVGAWTRTENADFRKQAQDLTDEAVGVFGAAFDGVISKEKADAKAKRDAKKSELEAKAKQESSQPDDASEAIEAALGSAAQSESMELDVDDVCDAAVLAITQGLFSADQLEALRAALADHVDAPALADIASMGANSPLLMAQAH